MRALTESLAARGLPFAGLRNQFPPIRLILLLGALLLLLPHPAGAHTPPNILFIVMDDVGIDQLQAFNPASPVATPNIDTLVTHGVRFTSNWMMPECSPRAF
jgi:hypothetical protein